MGGSNFINEDGIVELMAELDRYTDNISELFDSVDREIGDLPVCYKGSTSESIMNSYQNFRKNYKTIKNNLVSYSDDYAALIRKMKAGTETLSKMFTNFAEDTKLRVKNVVDKGGF